MFEINISSVKNPTAANWTSLYIQYHYSRKATVENQNLGDQRPNLLTCRNRKRKLLIFKTKASLPFDTQQQDNTKN